MIEIIKELSIEVTKPNIFQALVAKQYDMNTRFLKVTLMDCGTRIDVPNIETAKVVINAERKDGQSKGFDGVINEDGTVTVPLHSWMLELDGTVICDISVIDTATDDNKKLTTTSFTLIVEKAAYGGNDVTNDPQYDVLVELMENCQEANTAAQEALNKSNEALKKSAEADSKYDACVEATANANAVRAEIEAGGFIESLKEMNTGEKFTFWVGTQAEYDSIPENERVTSCFYIITDDKSKENLQTVLTSMQTNIDALNGRDYIVEQGADMHEDEHYGWTWRKWNSGLVELWGTCDVETAFTIKVAEGHWEGESFPNLAYPFPLINENGAIHVQFSIYYTAAKHHISYCAWYHGGGITTPTYTPYSATQITDVERITGRYYIMGRWKEEE